MKPYLFFLSILILAALLPGCDRAPSLANRPVDKLPVSLVQNIPYSEPYKLDVAYPDADGPWPILLLLHGGDEVKEMILGLGRALAARGIVVFMPTYPAYQRDLGKGPLLEGFAQATCGARYARAHAAEYGGTEERLIIAGYSLGGDAAAIIGLDGIDLRAPCVVDDTVSSLPDHVIGLDGAYDMPALIADDPAATAYTDAEIASFGAFAHIDGAGRQDEVAFTLFTGKVDILHDHGVRLQAALKEAGYRVTLTRFPDVDHGGFSSPYVPAVVDAVADAVWDTP